MIMERKKEEKKAERGKEREIKIRSYISKAQNKPNVSFRNNQHIGLIKSTTQLTIFFHDILIFTCHVSKEVRFHEPN